MTINRRRLLALAAVALLLAWVGYRHLGRSRRARAERAAAEPGRVPPPGYRFEDGRLVRREAADLDRLWRDLRNRQPGLLLVAGTVRDDDTDQPVGRAEVVFASAAGEASAQSDGDGRYQIHLAPGAYRAFARAEGYVAVGAAPPPRIPGRPEASEVGTPRQELAPLVNIGADQDPLDLHLRGAAQVVGTVYDGAGHPVAGAVVVAHLNQTDGYAIPRSVVGSDMDETDLDGSYRLVVPAGAVRLDASHADFAGVANSYETTLLLGAGDVGRVDLTLAAGCIISGTAVDADGYRVAEGALELYIGGEPPNDFTPVSRLDDRGEFRLALAQTGDVTLRAWPWKSAPAVPQHFDCRDGARYRNVLFVAPTRKPDLDGVIVTAAGEPVPYAYIDVFPLSEGGMAQQERADKNGDWAVFALPAGDYEVTAYVPGGGATATRVTVPDTRIELRLGGIGSLAGRVEGIDYGSFTLIVEQCQFDYDEGEGAITQDAVSMPATVMMVPVVAGEYRVDGIPACPIVGRARAGDREVPLAATVPADGVAEVALDLRAPVRKNVFGVVRGPGGAPAPGVTVVAAGDNGSAHTVTDAEGRYEIAAWGGQPLLFCGGEGDCTFSDVSTAGDPSERIDVVLP